MMKKMIFSVLASLTTGAVAAPVAHESAREIPVAGSYDVVVVGGTVAGVAAAVAARESGANVFLAASHHYLGEDLAATLELDNDGAPPTDALVRTLWSSLRKMASYSFTFDAEIAPGPYAYCNDMMDRVSDSTWPMTPAETTVFSSNVTYCCEFDVPQPVERVDVVVAETPDDWLTAACRPKKGMDSRLAKVASVTLEADGQTIALSRTASRESGGPYYRRRANLVTFSASLGRTLRRAKVRFELDSGAQEICVSRVWFRLPQDEEILSRPTPLRVKQTLDRLLVGRIPFLTASPVTEVLRDGDGQVSGVVVANRSGRQAFRARCVIDATRWNTLSHLGVGIQGISGETAFTRVIVTNGVELVRLPLRLPMVDGSFASFAAAEELARELTWTPRMRDDADELVLCAPLGAFPARSGLISVNPQVSLERRVADGRAAGARAAAFARARSRPKTVTVEPYPDMEAIDSEDGDVREILDGLRAYRRKPIVEKVHSPARALPVLAACDVLVCGGGTSGAAAALGAARGGAKTIVAEWLGVLGGVGTDGMVVSYCAGNNCGFSRRFEQMERRLGATHVHSEVREAVSVSPDPEERAPTPYYRRTEAWRRLCRDAGVRVWYGTFVQGAYVSGRRVIGAVVVTPFGRGVIRAKSVIDATGNADVAAAAGAETEFIPRNELQIQSAGQAPQRLRGATLNTDFGFVNDADAWDLWLFGLRARAGAPDAWDLQRLPDSRERRRIVPDYAVCGPDVVADRHFPDTVVRPYAPQDAHGPLMDEFCYISAPSGNAEWMGACSYFHLNVPLRSLLPRGFVGLAVVGVAAGCARDVMPMVRMQSDLMNMGYSVGIAATLSQGGDFRKIDLAQLRRRLVDETILDAVVLDWNEDADYTSDDVVSAAVASMADSFRGSDVVFRKENRAKALPLLRTAWRRAKTTTARLVYAQVLGLFGDATGVETLIDAARGKIDFEQVYRRGRYGDRVSDMTGVMLALGRTRSPLAVAPIADALAGLKPNSPLESVRAVSLAAEAIGDPRLADGLAARLMGPGVGGHAVDSVARLGPQGGYGPDFEMCNCMRELAYARALLFCGDKDNLARRTFEAYAADPRGVLSEYASAVLRKVEVK